MSGVVPTPPNTSAPKGFLARLLVPPDFYPERSVRREDWVEGIFEPGALVGAITCFAIGLYAAGLALAPGWRVDFAVPLTALTALIGFLYSRRLARGAIIAREWLVCLLPIALAARILPALAAGPATLASAIGEWTATPAALFDFGYIVYLLILFGAWLTAFFSAQDLNAIRLQPGEILALEGARTQQNPWESERIRSVDHTQPLAQLAGRFVVGGLMLIILASITAVDIGQLPVVQGIADLLATTRPTSAVAYANVILYWVLVLLLIGEAQYVRRRTLWRLDEVPLGRNVGTTWIQALVLVVAAGVVVGAILPTDVLLGLGDVMQLALYVVAVLASYVVGAILLVFYVLTLPLRWLMTDGGGASPPSVAPPRFPEAPPSAGPNSLIELLKSLLFWGAALAVIAYAASAYWRERRHLRGFAAIARLGEVVITVLRRLWLFLTSAGRAAQEVVRAVLPRFRSAPATGPSRPSGFRSLLPDRSARARIEALYLTTLERAARGGYRRAAHQTPSEYAAQMRESLPEVEGDLDTLTDVFLAARFSRRDVVENDVGVARRAWDSLRRRFQAERHPGSRRKTPGG